MIRRCNGVSCVNFYFSLFRTNGKKWHVDKNGFHTVMAVFSKVLFWKLLDHSYIQSSFSAITRHINNNVLKDTLQLRILRTWINIRANSFTNKNDQLHKIPSLHVKEIAPKKMTFCLFICVFIGIFFRFRCNLFFLCLLIFYGSWSSFTSFKSFFVGTSKI